MSETTYDYEKDGVKYRDVSHLIGAAVPLEPNTVYYLGNNTTLDSRGFYEQCKLADLIKPITDEERKIIEIVQQKTGIECPVKIADE